MKRRLIALATLVAFVFSPLASAWACTGITLHAKNGDIVYGRTVEWGMFDLHMRTVITPRGEQFVGVTPEGKNGLRWKGKYGIVGFDALHKRVYIDAVNEKGLAGGVFYHPGYAKYPAYLPSNAKHSIAPTQVMDYVLSTCATIKEVRAALNKVRVVPTVEPALGIPAPFHFMFSDANGKQIVVEWADGRMRIFDAPLGVITNAPTYDWHITNLRNYINLSPVGLPGVKVADIDLKPLGAGSGMIGLPGDFTPPSRFVRAVAFTQTARPTDNGKEAMYEVFRILDSFNVPLGSAEGSTGKNDRTKGMRSATLMTDAIDLKQRIIYYHSQHNRRVRMIDLKRIDFGKLRKVVIQPLDEHQQQDIKDRTPLI